jgi:hypothetical protein
VDIKFTDLRWLNNSKAKELGSIFSSY